MRLYRKLIHTVLLQHLSLQMELSTFTTRWGFLSQSTRPMERKSGGCLLRLFATAFRLLGRTGRCTVLFPSRSHPPPTVKRKTSLSLSIPQTGPRSGRTTWGSVLSGVVRLMTLSDTIANTMLNVELSSILTMAPFTMAKKGLATELVEARGFTLSMQTEPASGPMRLAAALTRPLSLLKMALSTLLLRAAAL